MLYIFYGTDEVEAREKVRALISGLQKKAPDAELVRVTDDSGNTVDIDGLLSTQGLFKQNYILFLDTIDNVILGFSDIQLEAMKRSEHICVVLMGKLLAKDKKVVERYANKMTEYTKDKMATQSFNVFSVANALKSRSRPQLWQALTEARLAGSGGEALTGMLFWAVKDMLTKGQYNTYTEQELKNLAILLAALPHKARRDAVSIHNALEKFALSSI